MSITQEQYDALKPGDQVRIGASRIDRTVVGTLEGRVWLAHPNFVMHATAYPPASITAIIPPAPHPVAWVNLDADEALTVCYSRRDADRDANPDRTHVITIYSDGTTTTEAVS